MAYVPEADPAWAVRGPADVGMNAARVAETAAFAAAGETPWPRDLERVLREGQFEPPPWNEILGPVRPRGGPNGLLLRHGYLVAAWGDTRQVDQTFSVAKSYLAVLAGIAWGDGLIRDLRDPVRVAAPDDGFEAPQNRSITWEHLLQQTSEWEGTLWDKPDLVDRNRAVGGGDNSRKGQHRPLQPPGRYWEYNDVRVNRLSLSLMRLFRRPLPEVLRERVMRPIGASEDWRWDGYRNSFVEIDGRRLQSVPGGSHWGGGLSIHARDQARLGLLVLRGGRWGERQVLPEGWTRRMLAACPIYPAYGYLWWLNTGRARYPSAPDSSVFALGAGGNVIWVDPDHDLVVVARWLDDSKLDALIGKLLAALA